ncbi:MAG: TetR/AcrR family transcriptional regulator [Frankiaceae bacterium]|jgi:AcrR family transcriptional regulator|nr:TetR/AcrR family transcriptional regulator [Frankiaceae bacterium]
MTARSGNGMTRSRACILSGAAKCIARYGTRKTTMGDIAREGGTAKATVYNHFRTKADVYAALLADEVDDLLTSVAGLPGTPGSAESVVDAAAFAAEWLSEHPVLRALREREPELAARLARPGDGALWVRIRHAALARVSLAVAAGALHPQTDPVVAVDTLLRWAVSYVTWPAAHGGAHAAARQVVHGLLAPPYAAPDLAPAAPAPLATSAPADTPVTGAVAAAVPVAYAESTG